MTNTSPFLSRLGVTAAAVASAFSLMAGTPSQTVSEPATTGAEVNWLTGEGVNIGGIIFPHAHFQAVYGTTSADDVEHLGAGHHDPTRDDWTIQGFEFGTSVRLGEYFEAFGAYHVWQDSSTYDWDGQFEEWFGKIKNLPGGFELRGGRYLNRFGLHNSVHLHGWSYVDNNLVNGRFLGDDGLYTIGGEATWNLPTPWTSVLSFSVGEVPEHEHEHVHGAEEHEHEHPAFEGEDALFEKTVFVLNWTNQFNYNDFHQFRAGASGAWGKNKMGKTTQVYGVHFQYEWRQNGFEAGGSYFRWRTEAMYRAFDYYSLHEEEAHEEEHAHEEGETEEEHAEHEEDHGSHVHRGSEREFGIYTALAYGFDNGIELGLRGEYVGGVANTELDERYRVSPVATYYFNKNRTLYLRAQYNFDHSNDFGEEHSVWAQIGFNWGGPEVR